MNYDFAIFCCAKFPWQQLQAIVLEDPRALVPKNGITLRTLLRFIFHKAFKG